MDILLGEEERELRFLIADHCQDIFSSFSKYSSSNSNNTTSGSSNNQNQNQNAAFSLDNNNSNFANSTNLNSIVIPRSELSHAITVVLAHTGWSTLLDIMTALKEHRFSTHCPSSSLSEDSLRLETKRLLLHGVIRYDSRTGRYGLDLVVATLRILFPLMVDGPLVRSLGGVAEQVFHLLYDHNDLPLAVISNMVSDMMPQVNQSVIEGIVKKLQTEDWIIQVSSASTQTSSTSTSSHHSSSSSLVASFGINYAKFLARYRSDTIVKYLAENMSSPQRNILHQLASQRIKEPRLQQSSSAEENPSPKLPILGQEVSLNNLNPLLSVNQNQNQMNAASQQNIDVKNVVRSLMNEPQPIVQVMSSSSSVSASAGAGNTNNTVTCRFDYSNAQSRVRRSLMCSDIRTRFGVIGQRVVKILFDHNALEDKTIAEEGLIPLADLHSLLLSMQNQGVLSLQELLKVPSSSHSGGSNINISTLIQNNSGPERSTKQSIFLWRLQERHLLAMVRKRICKTICALRIRLRSECDNLGIAAAEIKDNSSSSASSGGPQAPPNSAAASTTTTTTSTTLAVSSAAKQRYDAIHEHFSKALSSLYEELAITMFF